MNYRVGQVLYVVLKKEMRIFPLQVVEQITKKSLEGETTTYMVRGGTDPKALLLITDVDGEIFDSAEKARVELTERATSSITKLVAAATQKAQEWYPNSFEAPSDEQLSLIKKTTAAKAPAPSRPRKGDAISELAKELQQESDAIAGPDGSGIITLPDGSKAKVRSVKLPEPLQ